MPSCQPIYIPEVHTGARTVELLDKSHSICMDKLVIMILTIFFIGILQLYKMGFEPTASPST